MIDLHEFSQSEAWLARLLTEFQAQASAAIAARGTFSVALSGGSTPRPFYEALNRMETLPWDNITWWLGDERTVPVNHADSNEHMVRDSLGKDIPEFDESFRSWHQAVDPQECAIAYGRRLCADLGKPPVFDLVLLGIGTDGHTASLFPGTTALEETHHAAMLNPVPQLKTDRWTITYPVLNNARSIWFLVKGPDKGPMVERLMERDTEIPSARIINPDQKLYWLRA